eukprot:jgi/Ulvmu1/4603/UM002_0332.1
MTQGSKPDSAELQARAASVRVHTGAVNARINRHKLGNPRVFVKRFLSLCKTAQTCTDKDKLQAEISDFIKSDLAVFKLQHKLAAMEQRSAQQNVEALRRKQNELQGQIQVVEGEIQQKKEELEESKVRKQHLEEYEQLKKSIMCYPKQSETQAAIEKIQAEIAELHREGRKLDQTVELRRKQFCQLGLVLRDLSTEVEYPPGETEETPDGANAMDVE